MRLKLQRLLLLLLIALPLFGCATTTKLLTEHYTDPLVLETEILCPKNITWHQERPGIDTIEYTIKEQNILWKCVRINLSAPELSIQASPHKNELGKKFFHKKFAKKNNSYVVINTTPFDLDGGTNIPVSVVKIDGNLICSPNEGYSALLLTRNIHENTYQASIIKKQTESAIQNADYAFGGFYTILENHKIYQFEKYKRSRSAAGINEDGTILYLFAACGINCPTGRNGLNFEECAIILQELGCTSALEFDGGHSTGLVLNQQNFLRPTLQRKVPALLGFSLK